VKNKEILMKAIEKAERNGFNPPFDYDCPVHKNFNLFEFPYTLFIFSHDFAKSFWRNKQIRTKKCIDKLYQEILNEGWQYHLQRMVLQEEPLKYLEKFL
jgi:hypothetical protein